MHKRKHGVTDKLVRISEYPASARVCLCTDGPAFVKVPEASIPYEELTPNLKVPYLLREKNNINKVY